MCIRDRYRAEDYDEDTGRWYSALGDVNRDANSTGEGEISVSSYVGHASSANVTSVNGDTTAQLLFPDTSSISQWTLCHITRYTSNDVNDCGRIFQDNVNSLFGHYGLGTHYHKRGLVHLTGTWMTSQADLAHGMHTDWLVFCMKTGGATPGNILVDGGTVGTGTKTAPINQLQVNRGLKSAEVSDFAINDVIFWDRELSDADMLNLSNVMLDALRAN